MRLFLDHNQQLPITREGARLIVSLAALEDPDSLATTHFLPGLRLGALAPTYDAATQTLCFEDIGAEPQTLTLYDEPLVTIRQRFQSASSPLAGEPLEHSERGDLKSNTEPNPSSDLVRGNDAASNPPTDLQGQVPLPLKGGARSSGIIAPSPALFPLTVDELRLLSLSDIPWTPFARALFRDFDPTRHAPITDLHTHSSAQLSNAALMDLALSHGLSYPVELLSKLNITLSEEERLAVEENGGFGARFAPTEHELPRLACETQNARCDVIPLSALSPTHRARLMAQLHIPQDMTLSFSDFDRSYYRFVNPLVKNAHLTRDMILSIARDYAARGVRYAELSTASMLNLDAHGEARWFKEMIAAVAEAEAETGVRLRFLIGVPRSFGPAKLMAELEKITFAARHPLIVGVDLLGYESNRTSDFSAILSHLAQWARSAEGTRLKPEHGWNFGRDFTIRIHAGETGKNSGNVAEAVRIAEIYGIRVRVAHAVNEALDDALDARIAALSSHHPPLLMMEFCPSSNLAYNNIQSLGTLPFRRWISCCKHWFLGSDGAGAIQTTPTQLALAALAAGCTLEDLARLRTNEEAFIAEEVERFAAKSRAFMLHYGEEGVAAFLRGFASHVQKINRVMSETAADPSHPLLPKRFQGRMPILVAGASGESFREIAPEVQQKIRVAMQQLVATLDPTKIYFVVGRSKPDGVTAALDEAVVAHNARHPRRKFLVLALITEDIPDLPRAISWVVPQPGTRIQVPENIIAFLRGRLRPGLIPGVAIFIGGSNYTSDMILKCRQHASLAYLLMENAHGASADFARLSAAELRFADGDSLLARLRALGTPIAGP